MRPDDVALMRHRSEKELTLPPGFTFRYYPDSELYLVQPGTP